MGTGQQTEPLFHYLESKHAVLCLAFIGGFIDATGYVKLYGLFTSSITGNLVVGCAAMFGSGAGVFARVFVTLLFALGAFFTTIAATNLRIVLKKNQWETGMRLFCYEVVCLFVAMIFGIGVDFAPGGIPDIGSWQAIMAGSLLALSMGVHNAAAQDLIVNCPSTTVMTMTIIKTSMFAANAVQHWMAARGLLLLHAPNEKPENYIETVTQKHQANFAKFIESVQPLIVFVIGASSLIGLPTAFTYGGTSLFTRAMPPMKQ